MIYEIPALLDMFRTRQENSMVEHSIHTLHDKGVELSSFREVMRSFKDCEKHLSRKTENRAEKNAFMRGETIIKLEKIAICRVRYKQCVAVVFMSQMWGHQNCRKS